MRICAIKVCRNYWGRLKTAKKVTYHRIPNDPILRSKWIDIIRKSREEDIWKPAKTTVVCSDHFRTKDLYFVKDRRRLKKEAIPCKALFLTSLNYDDESDNSIENIEQITCCGTNVVDDTESLKSNEKESCDDVTNNENTLPGQATSSKLDRNTEKYGSDVNHSIGYIQQITCCGTNVVDDTESLKCNEKESCDDDTNNEHTLPGQATRSKLDRNTEKYGSDVNEDFSDVDSIFDSPEEGKLRRQLRRKIKLQKKHTLMIQSLRRKNLRLKKKIASFQQILETLKKKDI